MVDISKHPILRQIYELCLAIEACGASTELTNAVALASALNAPAEALIQRIEHLEKELSSKTSKVPFGHVPYGLGD